MRVTGVCVVDDRSGRPIGFAGTVLRWFAHLLDAVLMIGYLRAAWHRQGRTFADSLVPELLALASVETPQDVSGWTATATRPREP